MSSTDRPGYCEYCEYGQCTEGLNTASTESMSSKITANAGASAESNPKCLGAWSIEYPQDSTPKYCEYLQSIYSRNTACNLSTPVAPHEIKRK